MDGIPTSATTADLDRPVTASANAGLLGPYALRPAVLEGSRRSEALKRAMDVVLAGTMLVAFLPIMVAAALLIRLTSGPQVLLGHLRVGRDGHLFRCLKFRSMVHDGDQVLAAHFERNPAALAEWRERRKLSHDPRVTPLGRFLRRSSIDELPQLLNVLRGEMSLVGPRPLPVDYVPLYAPRQALRLRVRPGLAGLAQAAGRNAVGWAARLEWDARYAERPPRLSRDIALLLRCAALALTARGTAAPGHASMPAFRGEGI